MPVEYMVRSLTESIQIDATGRMVRGYDCRFRTASGIDASVFIPQSELAKLTPEEAGAVAQRIVGAEAERLEAVLRSGEKSGAGSVLGKRPPGSAK